MVIFEYGTVVKKSTYKYLRTEKPPSCKEEQRKDAIGKHPSREDATFILEVFKIAIIGSDEILGLISLIAIADRRIQINLLAVSKENRGNKKMFEGIAGNLIAWSCREAVKRFGEDACVSLIPKTRLRKHYMTQYGMMEAGRSLFLSDEPLLKILEQHVL